MSSRFCFKHLQTMSPISIYSTITSPTTIDVQPQGSHACCSVCAAQPSSEPQPSATGNRPGVAHQVKKAVSWHSEVNRGVLEFLQLSWPKWHGLNSGTGQRIIPTWTQGITLDMIVGFRRALFVRVMWRG